jgi:hypothetical protein
VLGVKNKAITLALLLAIFISLVANIQSFKVANANFLPAPAIIIYSPASIIYTNKSISLNVAVHILNNSPEIVRILYSVDESSNVTVTNLNRTDNFGFSPNKWGSVFSVKSILEDLTEGNHILKAYSQNAVRKEMYSSVEFTINTQYRYPEVSILSPQNKTYTTTEVPLIWACDEQKIVADYMIDFLSQIPLYAYYTLFENEYLPGNTTLTGLINGTHTLTVNVITERGSAFQTVHFTVSIKEQLPPEPFPAILVIASAIVATVVLVSIGLLLYSIKRK